MSRSDELEAAISALLRPAAKCAPQRLTEEQIDILAEKQALRSLMQSLDLSRDALARVLGKSKACIDGWLNPRDFSRYPPKHLYRFLARRLGPVRGVEVYRSEVQSSVDAASELTGEDFAKTA